MKIHLKTGDRGTAVIDRPWIASRSMVDDALIAAGFAGIQWADGPGDLETIQAQYIGPESDFDAPEQVKSFSIMATTPNSSGQPQFTPSPTPIKAMKDKAAELMQSPAIGYAVLFDMFFIMSIKKIFFRKKEK